MNLIWIDLETTGLEPHRDVILEVALSRSTLEDPFNAHPIYHQVMRLQVPDAERLRYACPFVFDMHTKNGLLEECRTAPRFAREVEQDLLDLIPDERQAHRDRLPVLAGSTVHFDRGFMAHWWPHLEQRFSHRHYDVSAVKLFCQSLGMEPIAKGEAHRAKDDIDESIRHARQCLGWLAALRTWGPLAELQRTAERVDAIPPRPAVPRHEILKNDRPVAKARRTKKGPPR